MNKPQMDRLVTEVAIYMITVPSVDYDMIKSHPTKAQRVAEILGYFGKLGWAELSAAIMEHIKKNFPDVFNKLSTSMQQQPQQVIVNTPNQWTFHDYRLALEHGSLEQFDEFLEKLKRKIEGVPAITWDYIYVPGQRRTTTTSRILEFYDNLGWKELGSAIREIYTEMSKF